MADATVAVELLEFQADGELERELQTNLARLNCSLEEFELEQLLSGPRDKNGAYLIINPAKDDLDARFWAEMLLRMYACWGRNKQYKVALVDEERSDIGINSATLAIDGRYACGYLKSETGVHLLKRTSPFNITKKSASPATLEVLPMYVELEIPQQDLEIILPSRYLTSGNKNWVRIVHVPTGISARSQEERSQQKNKETALAVLTSKLFAIMQRQKVQQLADIQLDRLQTVLKQPIRKYEFASDSTNQDLVLDFRTGIQTAAVADVLDGTIDRFIAAGVLRTQDSKPLPQVNYQLKTQNSKLY